MRDTKHQHSVGWWTRIVALVLAAAAVCYAQDAAPKPPAPAAEVAETQEPEATQPEGPDSIILNFRDAPLAAVIEHLSETAGLVIVEEADVQGRVTVMSRRPLDTAEAVALLNTVLTDQGFAAVRTGRTLKIVALSDAKTMNVPVRAGSDPEAIQPTDEMITQVIPLKFADAQQTREDLAPLIPSYATLTANASSNSLILTDTAANVRRVVEVIRALDTHMATVSEVRVFPLTYASATDAATLITNVFKQEENAGQRGGATGFAGRFFRRSGRDDQQEDEQVSRAPNIIASATGYENPSSRLTWTTP